MCRIPVVSETSVSNRLARGYSGEWFCQDPAEDCGEALTPRGGRCDACQREYQRQYRAERKETHPEYFRDYYRRNQETRKQESREYARANTKANRARVKAWRQANPELAREQSRRKRAAKPELYNAMVRASVARNPEKRAETMRRWKKRHPETARQLYQRYRARKHDAYVADVVEDEVLRRDRGICGICGKPIMFRSRLTTSCRWQPAGHTSPITLNSRTRGATSARVLSRTSL